MSKKTFMAAIVITGFLVSLVAGMHVANVAEANPIPPAHQTNMIIQIVSPQNGTATALPVIVNFTEQSDFIFGGNSPSFFYVLDGQNMTTSGMRFTEIQYPNGTQSDSNNLYHYSGQVSLSSLTFGFHNITVYFGELLNVGASPPNEIIDYNASWSDTSVFYVNTEMTPSPSTSPSPTPSPTLSPSPSTTPSSTLSTSPSPSPTQTPTLTPSPTPDNTQENLTPILIIVGLVVAVVVVGLLVYFRKRRG